MDARVTYKNFAQFYDLYTKDFQADIFLYKALSKDCTDILEVGCGTGRVLKELVAGNKIITGVDISKEMLEIANKKLKTSILDKSIILLEHDFSFNSMKQKYDICLITWYTFNYIFDNAVIFLRNVLDSLHKGAPIVLDMFYPQALKHPEINNKWVEKEIYLENKKYLVKDKRTFANNIEQRIQIFEVEKENVEIITHRLYYSKADMQNKLLEAGFSEISFIENYDLSTLHTLGMNEKTDDNYICIAKNAPPIDG